MKTIRERYFEMDVADQVANHAMRLCDGLTTQEECVTVLNKAYWRIRELEGSAKRLFRAYDLADRVERTVSREP